MYYITGIFRFLTYVTLPRMITIVCSRYNIFFKCSLYLSNIMMPAPISRFWYHMYDGTTVLCSVPAYWYHVGYRSLNHAQGKISSSWGAVDGHPCRSHFMEPPQNQADNRKMVMCARAWSADLVLWTGVCTSDQWDRWRSGSPNRCNCCCGMLCRICMICMICTVQIPPRKRALEQIIQIMRLPPCNMSYRVPGRSYSSSGIYLRWKIEII